MAYFDLQKPVSAPTNVLVHFETIFSSVENKTHTRVLLSDCEKIVGDVMPCLLSLQWAGRRRKFDHSNNSSAWCVWVVLLCQQCQLHVCAGECSRYGPWHFIVSNTLTTAVAFMSSRGWVQRDFVVDYLLKLSRWWPKLQARTGWTLVRRTKSLCPKAACCRELPTCVTCYNMTSY